MTSAPIDPLDGPAPNAAEGRDKEHEGDAEPLLTTDPEAQDPDTVINPESA